MLLISNIYMMIRQLVDIYHMLMEDLLVDLDIIIGLKVRKVNSRNIILRKLGDHHITNSKRHLKNYQEVPKPSKKRQRLLDFIKLIYIVEIKLYKLKI